MKSLTGFFNAISPLKEKTWEALLPLFKETTLSANDYFVRENEVARKSRYRDIKMKKLE